MNRIIKDILKKEGYFKNLPVSSLANDANFVRFKYLNSDALQYIKFCTK